MSERGSGTYTRIVTCLEFFGIAHRCTIHAKMLYNIDTILGRYYIAPLYTL